MATPLPNIQHVILLMFENRSFDNVLGAFYPFSPDSGGVSKDWSNPWASHASVTAWQGPAVSATQNIPYPDPQESDVHMGAQINTTPPMMGFVNDYATVTETGVNPPDIMQYFVTQNVPVTQALASTYAVSDRYFASGPVQTWPNRLFSLCGTPCFDAKTKTAYLNNHNYPDYPFIIGQLDQLSIFEQLDQARHSWKIYYDDEVPVAAVIRYVNDHWDHIWDGGNVWPFESHPDIFHGTFFEDVAKGRLPTFSLIEPRYQMLSFRGEIAPNSNHPGDSLPVGKSGIPINVSCGEQMLAKVFQALVGNPALFATTLLVVTYDEHGGLFDHVTPPTAKSPFQPGTVTGFDYSRYGVRVPTLFINPYVKPGIFRAPTTALPFDHTSLLATLKAQFSLSGSLSPRVDVAPTFAGLINPTQPAIKPPTIPMPACNWDSSTLRLGHAHPMIQTALLNAARRKIRGSSE